MSMVSIAFYSMFFILESYTFSIKNSKNIFYMKSLG